MVMKMKKHNYQEHDFYCIRCGNKGIPLLRQRGFQHSDNHRKKLYCTHCKTEVNHIECKSFADVEQFKIDFENGVYINEAEDSVSRVRNSRLG